MEWMDVTDDDELNINSWLCGGGIVLAVAASSDTLGVQWSRSGVTMVSAQDTHHYGDNCVTRRRVRGQYCHNGQRMLRRDLTPNLRSRRGLWIQPWHMSRTQCGYNVTPGLERVQSEQLKMIKSLILNSQRDLLNLSKSQSWNWLILSISERWTLGVIFSNILSSHRKSFMTSVRPR